MNISNSFYYIAKFILLNSITYTQPSTNIVFRYVHNFCILFPCFHFILSTHNLHILSMFQSWRHSNLLVNILCVFAIKRLAVYMGKMKNFSVPILFLLVHVCMLAFFPRRSILLWCRYIVRRGRIEGNRRRTSLQSKYQRGEQCDIVFVLNMFGDVVSTLVRQILVTPWKYFLQNRHTLRTCSLSMSVTDATYDNALAQRKIM